MRENKIWNEEGRDWVVKKQIQMAKIVREEKENEEKERERERDVRWQI